MLTLRWNFAARDIVRNAITADRIAYDGFMAGHSQDSGLWEAKSVVDMPLAGLAEATMLHACALGLRIGIVIIHPRFVPGFQTQIRRHGLVYRIAGVEAMPFEPAEMTAAFDSDEQYQKVLDAFNQFAEPLVRNGVDVLIPGGGIPMLLFEREHNFNVMGAPVINGIPILVKMTEMAVEMQKLNDLGMSRSSDMMIPPDYILEELLGK
jgi:allantoin racemase